jgi:PHD/YefM family antitoxin component YafN of YafNO toxin-antitoxin module
MTLQYMTNEQGAKTAVVVPLPDFEQLMEDVEDLAAVAERRNEETISHEEVLKSLKADGLL